MSATWPLSVYIVTLNCAPWLADTLDSVRDAAEVIILDSGSTDETWTIASRYPNVRISHQDWLGYAAQKALALSRCTQPWVLNLDGDEVLSPELAEEIRTVMRDDTADGLIIPVCDVFMGRLPHPAAQRHAKVRCFRRGKGSYDTGIAVHEAVHVAGKLVRARADILHFGETSIAVKVDKNNRYSSLKADEKAARGKRFKPLKLLVVFPLTFFKSYVLRRNCLNGWPGLIGSAINAFYAFLKEAKLYEATQRPPESS